MSTASVQVLCPNGKRCTVKVNGETTLLQVSKRGLAIGHFAIWTALSDP